jgi:DNA-3-methyladenine glycosylase
MKRLNTDFYIRDVLEVAPELLGKTICRQFDNGQTGRYIITEVEAYNGIEDEACHASKGCTPRTDVMFREGGLVYVYLIYGMYWMLNVVTSETNNPQAILIRGIEGYNGPGKLTRQLRIDNSFYGEDLARSKRIWIEDHKQTPPYTTGPRVGIDYAGTYWRNIPWRFTIDR